MQFILKRLSRFAEQVLAAAITPIEMLSRAFLRAPMGVRATSGMAGQFAGRTTLASGTATATVSTTNIKSDSLVHMTFQCATLATSGTAGTFGVSSIVHGVSMSIGYVDGAGRGPGGTLMWEIRRTS
jgi:hypothetical protein